MVRFIFDPASWPASRTGPAIVVPWLCSRRNGGHASRVAMVIMLPVGKWVWLGIVSNSWIVSPRAKIARRSCDPSYQPYLHVPCMCVCVSCIRSNEWSKNKEDNDDEFTFKNYKFSFSNYQELLTDSMKNNSSRQFWNPVHRFPNVNVLFFPRPRSGGEFKKWIELPHEITRFPRRRNWTVIGETKRNAWIVQKPLRIGKKWRSAGIIRLSYRATCWPFPFAKGGKKE